MTDTTTRELDANRDPITGEPGSHPVGTGVGATGGGVAGALAGGALGGPLGALIGGALGAIAGGAAGHAAAEAYDPTYEDAYWSENYRTRDYVTDGASYDRYRPAYAYGWNARRRYLGRRWEDVENDLERGWENMEDKVELRWEEAKHAVRDAWNRVESSFDRMFDDEDEYWRENYRTTDYYTSDDDYDLYRPAYRYGAQSRLQQLDARWEDIENDVERNWENFEDRAELQWDRAKGAVRDGWHSIERRLPGDLDNDGR